MPRGGKRPGSRRKKGVPSKVTAEVREAILKAFDLAGGVEYLCAVAREDPKAFCAQRKQRAVACQNRTRTGTFAPGCGRFTNGRDHG